MRYDSPSFCDAAEQNQPTNQPINRKKPTDEAYITDGQEESTDKDEDDDDRVEER